MTRFWFALKIVLMKINGQNIEILAPAGGREAFFAAVHAGADAVYLGLDDFSARKNAENFTADTLKYHVDYAHVLGVRVFVALNTLFSDAETPAFLAAAAAADAAGVDALIVQDIFWGKRLSALFPSLELHLSTQAGVCSAAHARLAREFSFCRVVAARETPLATLAEMAKILPVEAFVQGALCSAFSGQCYLSSFIGKNSGNRGLCKQPCRKKFSLSPAAAGIGAAFTPAARRTPADQSYALSTSDLCVGSRIFDLIKAGVSSFKIEGRMRRSEYVAAAVGYFRALLSGAPQSALSPRLSDLKRTYNRGNYTEGFAFSDKPANFLCTEVQGNIGEKIGVVTRLCGGGVAQTDAKFIAKNGDAVKLLRGGIEVGNGVFLLDPASTVAKAGAKIKFIGGICVGDEVRLTTDTALSLRLLSVRRGVPCTVFAEVCAGKAVYARAEAAGICVTAQSDAAAATARTAALTAEAVIKCFSKVDDFPFAPVIEVKTDGAAFAPVSELNAVRRQLFERLFNALADKYRLSKISDVPPRNMPNSAAQKNSVCGKIGDAKMFIISDDFSHLALLPTDAAVFAPADYSDADAFSRFFAAPAVKSCAARLLYLPAFLPDTALDGTSRILENFPDFDGIYAQSPAALELARGQNLSFVLGEGGNIYNSHSLMEVRGQDGVCGVCLSKELARGQKSVLMRHVSTGSDGVLSLDAGGICVMTLVHCPNKWRCGSCNKPRAFTLTDEGGKAFYLRRIGLFGRCIFELYNCAALVPERGKDATDVGGMQSVVCLLSLERKFSQKFLEGIRGRKSAAEIFEGNVNVYTYGYK